MARDLVGRGCYFGFSGMVTFTKADNVRDLLRLTPDDRILVETDTPYLAPVPHRGKPNQPAYVTLVASRIGAERAWSAEDTAARTAENFFRLFDRARR